MTGTYASAADSRDLAGLSRPPRPPRYVRRRRVVRGAVVVAVAAMSVACADDGAPSNAPTETTTRTESDGSVTTVPDQTPVGGSGAVEPGTNLVPSSDPGPPDSGSLLGGSDTSTGG